MIPGCILDGILRESRYGSIGDAITDTGRRHGRAEGDADPWDHTASEMAHAIAEWHSVKLARDYLTAYAEGFAEGTEARKLRRADSASEMLAHSTHAWAPGDVISADDPFLAPYDLDA